MRSNADFGHFFSFWWVRFCSTALTLIWLESHIVVVVFFILYSYPVNQLHDIHMLEGIAYTWKWIQSLFCTLLHWIRSVPGRCDDVVVVVRFGTYKAGFKVKDRAAPVVCVGRNTSVVFIISLYYGRLLSHQVWLTGIFAFVLKCPHTVGSFH